MKTISTLVLCCLGLLATGQNITDALRYSQLTLGGTARYTSMGGAFGALGGDVGAITSNPGAMGVYRRGELSFTPSWFTGVSSATLGNVADVSAKNNLNFGSIGYVGVYPATKSEKRGGPWKSWTLSIGYNRANQFQSRTVTEITNDQSSLIDQWLFDLNSNQIAPENIYENADPYGTVLAWDAFLIDTLNGRYISGVPPSYGQTQRYERVTRGRNGENFFGFGGNMNHKLYIGGTLGIMKIVYDQYTIHSETIATNSLDTLVSLSYFDIADSLSVVGNGYNFKLGAIYRVNNFLRVGAALHSPSVYNMTEEWSSKLEAEFEDFGNLESESPGGYYEYRMRTPWRVSGSAAFLIGKLGMVAADYELINYGAAKFGDGLDGYTFSGENEVIGSTLGYSGNLKVGTEWKVQPLAIRLGYAITGSPYGFSSSEGARTTYSGGIGLRQKDWYVDLAYMAATGDYSFQQYAAGLIDATEVSTLNHTFLATVGLKF